MRGSKINRAPSLLSLRRRRQAKAEARSRAYTLELAILHVQLMAAMAAVDEQVRHSEVEEILAFIDRPSLSHDDLTQLEAAARAALASPPPLEPLLAQLHRLSSKPAVARQVAEDLARVAAADAREDHRETSLLGTICDALRVPRVPINIDSPSPLAGTGAHHPPARPSGARHVVVQMRARSAVRQALEASYREDARNASDR